MGTQKFDGLKKRQYPEIRQDIRTGDILFAAGNYPISRMIAHFSDSIFSHVGFAFTWNSRVLLLQSVEDDGVHPYRLANMSQWFGQFLFFKNLSRSGRREYPVLDRVTKLLEKPQVQGQIPIK